MDGHNLLSIPTELRLLILEYLLAEFQTLAVGGCSGPDCLQNSSAPAAFGGGSTNTVQAIQPPVSLTSRQLRTESLPLFYRQNRFLLAVHYRRARSEVANWLDLVTLNPRITANLWNITIKHRFGILDHRGTVDFDLKQFSITGSHLWFNSIPPIYIKEVEQILDNGRQRNFSSRDEDNGELVIDTVRQLVEVLGVLVD